MARCHVCHDELSLPNDCTYCGEYYCSRHRLPENHQCPYLERVNTLGPDFRDGNSIPAVANGLPNRTKIAIGVVVAVAIATAVLLLI